MKSFHPSPDRSPFSLVHREDFAVFYEQAHLSVFKYVMVLCAGNQAEAEDITAEAFFKAWEKRAQFVGSSPAALGWVIAIARNLLIDRRRSENRQPQETGLDEDLYDPAAGIEDVLVDKQQLELILAAIHDLPFQQANILTLHLALGWRIKSIADHLGLAENTVTVNFHRALARLQTRLAPQEISSGSSK